MSAKMIKDGNEYPIGVIPQNVIDKVFELSTKKQISLSNLVDINVSLNSSYHNGIIGAISLVVTATSAISTWETVAKVNPAPASNTYLTLFDGGTTSPIGYALLETDGSLKILSASANDVRVITGTYFI